MTNEEKIVKLFNEGKIEEARKLSEEVNWIYVSIDQTLSEEFIKEFQNEVDWIYISQHQTLSEDFIREFQDLVYWNDISRYQKFSKEFALEFSDEIFIEEFLENEHISIKNFEIVFPE